MSCAEVLAAMDDYGTFVGDTGSDPVRAFDFLRPDPSCPNAPVLKFISLGLIPAMVDRYAVGITQQDDVPCFAKDCIKTIQLFLGVGDDSADGLPRNSQFILGEYVGR